MLLALPANPINLCLWRNPRLRCLLIVGVKAIVCEPQIWRVNCRERVG
jgi:hypothetical protein